MSTQSPLIRGQSSSTQQHYLIAGYRKSREYIIRQAHVKTCDRGARAVLWSVAHGLSLARPRVEAR